LGLFVPALNAVTLLLPFLPDLCFWLYIAATLVQLGYGGVVWVYLVGHRAAGSILPEPPPGASVVICARNEAKNLQKYLPAVLEQQYPGDWELVVVDDASQDGTPEVLKAFQEQYPRLKVVRVHKKEHPGKKHALSLGIAAARFDLLFLTDADCEPASGFWLQHMVAALTAKPETEIALGYAPTRPRSTFLNGWIRFETAQTAIQYFSLAKAGMPYMGVGRNLSWKRPVFQRGGGFETHLELPSGDDDLLVNAAATAENVAVCLAPESFVYSEGAETWAQWFSQKRRHLSAGKRYRPLHQLVLAGISLSQIVHYFLLLVLLLTGFGTITVAICYLVRSFFLFFLYKRTLPILRESRLLSQLPIYDTLLTAYYGAFVPLSLISNRHAYKWK
jgi:glycosyltransferase involved in cell wall biosynthesis